MIPAVWGIIIRPELATTGPTLAGALGAGADLYCGMEARISSCRETLSWLDSLSGQSVLTREMSSGGWMILLELPVLAISWGFLSCSDSEL